MKKNLAIITSHPIQYQVPLFQKLNKSKFLNVTVFFGSKHGYISTKKDLEFNKLINWNIRILEGYKFFFSKKEKDVDSFWLSFSQLKKKFTEEKIDKVLILGWNKVIYLQAIIISLRMGIPIYLRSENNLEKKNTVLNRLIKKLLFNLFFKLFDKIFYIGKFNNYFYRYYGVSNDKLIFAPYFVDKNFFKSSVDINKIKIIKKKLNLYNNEKIILFVGKLIDRKNPFLFIEYAKKIRVKCKFLIVGDGPLLKSLKEKIKKEKINNVKIIGFKNQIEIANYYKLCDFLFLPSKYETWGLVVNEAFAQGKPSIVTDKCGCRKDLIRNYHTGVTINHFYNKASLNKILKLLKIDKKKLKKNINYKNRKYSIENSFKIMEKNLK